MSGAIWATDYFFEFKVASILLSETRGRTQNSLVEQDRGIFRTWEEGKG